MRPLDSRNEQSAEALTPLHVGVRAYRRWRSLQELVVESLVVSLTMVMLDVLVDDEAQMSLAERDDTMDALFFDRQDEPLGIGVEIRTLRRQPDWPNIATGQDLATDPRVEGIAVMNQLTRGPQEAVDRIGQIADHLLQPPAIGLRVDPGGGSSARSRRRRNTAADRPG